METEGPNHRILDVQAGRGTNWATDDLVDALLKAAEDVARARPGSVMSVGNLGRGGGGDILWSVSHNSGRDGDLGFYLTGVDGRQVLPATVVPLDASGRAVVDGDVVRLDVDRNWRMVRSLLTNPSVSIQWIFVSKAIRRMLLEHARSHGEPSALVARAEEVLAQPARSRPHNDHFHVRIYCPPDDVYEGCRDTGSNRSWFVNRSDRAAARVRELLRLTRSPKITDREGAATVLGRMGDSRAQPVLARLLKDRKPRVRLAAAGAIRELGVSGIIGAVSHQIRTSGDDEVVAVLLDALDVHLPRASGAGVLGRLLDEDRVYVLDNGVFEIRREVRERALEAMARMEQRSVVDTLVASLSREGVDADAVNRALGAVTAANPVPAGTTGPALIQAAWASWWKQNRRRAPREWYVEALAGSRSMAEGSAGTDEGQMLAIALDRVREDGPVPWLRKFLADMSVSLPLDGIEPYPVLLEDLLKRRFGGIPSFETNTESRLH
jgi:hypothetical protein